MRIKKIVSFAVALSLLFIVSSPGVAKTTEDIANEPASVVTVDMPVDVVEDANIIPHTEVSVTTSNIVFSPEEKMEMEGNSIASMGGKAARSQANITTYDFGTITNTITASNPNDFIIFKGYEALFAFRFTSTNANYRLTLCMIDAAGYIYPTNTVFSPSSQAQLIRIPANPTTYPLYCWLVNSTGSSGQSYKFEFNQAVTDDVAWISQDLTVSLSFGANAITVNGRLVEYIRDNGYVYREGFNIPQSVTIGGNTCGGYRKLEAVLENVKFQREWSDAIMYGPYVYSGPMASSSCAVFIPVDVGSVCTMWYHDYMAGQWSTGINTDWLGNTTPIVFRAEHISSGGAGYFVFDALSGKMIDYYGNGNAYYYYGFANWPTFSRAPGAF